MKIAPRQITGFLTQPPAIVCAILLHGNDAGLRSSLSRQLAELYSKNLEDVFSVTRINSSSLSGETSKIVDAAAQIPMFDKRLVLVKGIGSELLEACKLLLANPVDDAMVIINATDTTSKHALVKLFESTKTSAAIGCYHDESHDIGRLAQKVFQQDNVSVKRDALDLICSRLGRDHAATKSELEKLALMAGPGGCLTLETVYDALGDGARLTVDDIANAIAGGRVSDLSVALRKAWLEETNCVKIIRGCQTYFSQLRMLGHAISNGQSPNTAVRCLLPPVHFKLQDNLIRHVKRWQPSRCMEMLDRLQKIEINIKSTTINDQTLTTQSLLGLCLRAQH